MRRESYPIQTESRFHQVCLKPKSIFFRSPMFDSLIHALNTANSRELDPALFTQDDTPQSLDDAYRIQLALLVARSETVAAWKVGGQGSEGDPICAAIGNRHLFQSNESQSQQFYPGAGVELEFYFTMNRQWSGIDNPLSDEEILNSIATFGLAIEWVDSRFQGWPQVAKLLQLADLQNNRALIVGPSYPYDKNYDFLSPQPHFSLDGKSLITGAGQNPIGDPRQLIPWVVRHCCRYQINLDQQTKITTGSYSGIYFPQTGGALRASFAGLQPLDFNLI